MCHKTVRVFCTIIMQNARIMYIIHVHMYVVSEKQGYDRQAKKRKYEYSANTESIDSARR